jgi:hypothetical protein
MQLLRALITKRPLSFFLHHPSISFLSLFSSLSLHSPLSLFILLHPFLLPSVSFYLSLFPLFLSLPPPSLSIPPTFSLSIPPYKQNAATALPLTHHPHTHPISFYRSTGSTLTLSSSSLNFFCVLPGISFLLPISLRMLMCK